MRGGFLTKFATLAHGAARPASVQPTNLIWSSGLWSKPNAEFERTIAFLRQQLFGAMMMTRMFLVIEFQVMDIMMKWREVFSFHPFPLFSILFIFEFSMKCLLCHLSPLPEMEWIKIIHGYSINFLKKWPRCAWFLNTNNSCINWRGPTFYIF